ncbi:hypothetical protein ES708_25011 [subsurface metagenome]
MIILERGTIAQEGIGKPDYSREIALGRTRPGITLKYRQTLGYLGVVPSTIASPHFPLVQPPLAAGDTIHLINSEDGSPTPFTIPVGYTLTVFQMGYGLNQDSRLLAYLDGEFCGQLMLASGGDAYIITEIAAFSSKLFDPTAASSHEVDLILENTGGADMEGAVSVWTILEAVGTEPLPSTKTVKCKNCGHEWEVPRETTKINCPECGQLNIYLDLSRIREL